MRVLFLTTIPSPYRVDFFNELGKLVDLTVLFERKASDERDDSWRVYRFINFQGIFLRGKKTTVNTAFCPEVTKYLISSWDHIIVANATTPTGMWAIQYMKMKSIPYRIEGDGGFAKGGKGLKERIKKHFISGAVGYFSTSAAHDKYYLTYGADKTKIYRYPFTSISQSYIENAQKPFDKEKIKKQLGIKEEIVVLTVGRFIYGKGFDVLLKASKGFPNNIGFYYVGGEPTEEYQQLVSDLELENTYFVGFKKNGQLMDYYRIADIFVLPTRSDVWGLVINEAMAFSLPIITTDRCIAGLELVCAGQNGYVVPVDDVGSLKTKIKELINDSELRNKFGRESQRKIAGYTIEKMTKAHFCVLSNMKELSV